jgi:hypothetical protein
VRGPSRAWPAPEARSAGPAGAGSDTKYLVGVGFVIAVLTLALVGAVVVVVSAPLRRGRSAQGARGGAGAGHEHTPAGKGHGRALAELESTRIRDELEAAREAKYREIRDAELDFRTGKLSRADYQAIDADLRAEAIEILNRLEPDVADDTAAGHASMRPDGGGA